MTVEAWETVTSSSTPSAPMTTPASTRPGSDSAPSLAPRRRVACSLTSPVMALSSMNSAASSAVSTRANVVPSIAAALWAPSPWVSEMVMSITADAPTNATPSGGPPSAMAGTTKSSTRASEAARPQRASAPRRRPKTTTRTMKITASAARGRPRSKSTKM